MVIVAYRPLYLCELGVLSGLPSNMCHGLPSIERVAHMCGLIFTIQDGYVYLTYQSVKDFLKTEGLIIIFQYGSAATYYTIFLKLIEIMSSTLRHDMYELNHPGISIDDVY
jgi:hypothetical protein